MAISYLTVKEGMYDPLRRFAVKNITDHDFTFTWNKKPITIKKGTAVELPHHLAVLATTRMVDEIMIAEAREDEMNNPKNSNPMWHSPKGLSMGIPDARKKYEDEIISELPPIDENNPQYTIITSAKAEEIMNDLKAEMSKPVEKIVLKPEDVSADPKEFEGVK